MFQDIQQKMARQWLPSRFASAMELWKMTALVRTGHIYLHALCYLCCPGYSLHYLDSVRLSNYHEFLLILVPCYLTPLWFEFRRFDCPYPSGLALALAFVVISSIGRLWCWYLLIAQCYLASLYQDRVSAIWDEMGNEPLVNFLPISKTFPPRLVSKPSGASQVGQYCESDILMYS